MMISKRSAEKSRISSVVAGGRAEVGVEEPVEDLIEAGVPEPSTSALRYAFRSASALASNRRSTRRTKSSRALRDRNCLGNAHQKAIDQGGESLYKIVLI